MKELVHNREISIRTYDLGDRLILIEGALKDHRYRLRHDEASEESKLVHGYRVITNDLVNIFSILITTLVAFILIRDLF